MTTAKYLMSFTTGGLFYQESVTLAELYLKIKSWPEVKKTALAENLLQTRTQSTAQRLASEITARLARLSDGQLQLLATGSRSEQNYLLWLATCKRYAFISDFAREVLREKFLCLEILLTHNDYDLFFHNQAQWHEELDNLSLSTRKKNRSVLFRIMKEAELLNSENVIIPALFSRDLITAIAADDPSFFSCFPVSDRDVKELI